MNRNLFWDRQHSSRLSKWELGDLLGVHPHTLHWQELPDLGKQPVNVIVDLARQLDMHPADLVPSLDTVLTNRRDVAAQDTAASTADDALTVLTALATATGPVATAPLAQALDWQLPRLAAALDHAEQHPNLGGPLVLRRDPVNGHTVRPRLDRLTTDQRNAIARAGRRSVLTEDEANALLAVIALGPRAAYAESRDLYTEWRDDHAAAETALRETGLIGNDHNHLKPKAHPDVLFSLRYRRVDDDASAIPRQQDRALLSDSPGATGQGQQPAAS